MLNNNKNRSILDYILEFSETQNPREEHLIKKQRRRLPIRIAASKRSNGTKLSTLSVSNKADRHVILNKFFHAEEDIAMDGDNTHDGISNVSMRQDRHQDRQSTLLEFMRSSEATKAVESMVHLRTS